nr:MAG TPA: hypothetical protein [Caudoviricetes sp.]
MFASKNGRAGVIAATVTSGAFKVLSCTTQARTLTSPATLLSTQNSGCVVRFTLTETVPQS